MNGYRIGEVLCIVAACVGTCGAIVFGAVLVRRGVAAERRRRARAHVYRARRRAERIPSGIGSGPW